eukprot:CAMPEP_0170461370 /NCGR_PEP_ID=MMETSP0123-20130129/7305_1 /TAXON_ID=182087 /ORGANISM="Favella ehrenbergii, Strain Fehren 1" /LENGTH=69 /DNA_ID=CAMNT_0010726381 /DNA_START=1053 /DNA_END=1262 /DNA_ORIENTATION=+
MKFSLFHTAIMLAIAATQADAILLRSAEPVQQASALTQAESDLDSVTEGDPPAAAAKPATPEVTPNGQP